jgi:uracil-DNA glycosylase family 4
MIGNWLDLNSKIITCRFCPRLVLWREEVARVKKRAFKDWGYWGKPVPGFGDENARVLVVGLAPGAHGSNRTGRMFTGDASGEFLYRALCKQGFANQPHASYREDDLKLTGAFITAICRCVPPGNHPTMDEIVHCQPFLLEEFRLLKSLQGVVALGGIAFRRMQVIFEMKFSQKIREPFSHGLFIPSFGLAPWLLASYHPSQQNTSTGRLTERMFDKVWKKTAELIKLSK